MHAASQTSRLRALSTPDVVDALLNFGISKVIMRGIRPMVSRKGTRAGRARTLRLLPDREDVKSGPYGSVNRTLYDSIREGEMLIVDAMGVQDKAVLGDMMFQRLCARGIEGIVVNGAVRDVQALNHLQLAVFAMGTWPQSFKGHLRAWEADCDVACGGVLVRPGDWIVADEEGVVVVPDSKLGGVLDTAERKAAHDSFSRALLAACTSLDCAYPLPDYMIGFIPEFERTGTLPTAQQIEEAKITWAPLKPAPI